MANKLPYGCFMFEGRVSSFLASKVPEPEGALMCEIRKHDRTLQGQAVYYMEELCPSAILAKVEHYQERVRDLVKSLNQQAQVVRSLSILLEMAKRECANDGEDQVSLDS